MQAWSLDRTLGSYRMGGDPRPAEALDPLELPAALRAHGFDTVQLCHFQLTSRDPGWVAELRGELDRHGVRLDALLVDDGDMTHPTDGADAEAWIASWFDTALALGAVNTRVIAGKTRTPDAVAHASAALGRLAARADGTRLLTENWFDVTGDADDVIGILEPLDGRVGLLVDLANWTAPTKYDDLARIAPYAETCHSKAHWPETGIDADEYRRSVAAVEDAGYRGPHALVYAGPGDEWDGLDALRDVLRGALAPS